MHARDVCMRVMCVCVCDVCVHVMCAHTCLHVYPWVCVYERDKERDEGGLFSGYFIPGSIIPKANFTFALFLLYYKSQEIT